MIEFLPAKHVRLNETIIGLGAVILRQLRTQKSVDQLWRSVRELKQQNRSIPDKVTLEDVILTIDFLYALRAIVADPQGLLSRCV